MNENILADKASFRRELVGNLISTWDFFKGVFEGKINSEKKITVEDVLRGDSEEIKKNIKDELMICNRDILNNLESGLSAHKELFAVLRPKVLRAINDAIRNLEEDIKDYHILKIIDTQKTIVYKREG